MKAQLNNILAAGIVSACILFVTFAVIAVVRMTESGLIHWNR